MGEGSELEGQQRLVALLIKYGEAKFGDDWWPGEPYAYLPADEANELADLLEQRPITLADLVVPE